MKLKLCSILFLLVSGVLTAQAPPASSGARQTDNCGPLGCLGGGGGGAVADDAAQVVIRTSNEGSGTALQTAPVAQPKAIADPPTEFEDFVSTSLGHPLKVFGRDLFSNAASSFAPPSNVAPTADYIVGTGDEIVIRTWGKIDINVRATVDKNGQIFVPRLGTIAVAGVRYSDLTEFIRNAISQQFKGFELTVTLAQLRSIQVFILGQAKAPGLYTISSLSTLVNALFLSGGPSSVGTLRDIQIKRGNNVITHFDVYDLLLRGDKSKDVQLLPGDIIYIPRVGPQVAIDGDVVSPAIYELRGNETVGNVLQDAGGLTALAKTARAVLEHVVGNDRRTIEELALNTPGLAIPLTGGDILRIFPISPKIEGAVTVRGPVASPGRYAWHAGMRVSDLLPSLQFLIPRSYYNRQNADAAPAVDFTSTGGGAVKAAPTNTAGVSSTAADSSTVESSMFGDRHELEINWNHAVIERLRPNDLTPTLIPFALKQAITEPNSAANLSLEAGDTIIIYSRKDLNLPIELQTKFVQIDGQVNSPGVYEMRGDESLRDLVARAGGLAPHAYLYGAQLTRVSVRQTQEMELQELLARESRDVYSPSNTSSALPGVTSTNTGELELRRAFLAELRKLHATGRVSLQVEYTAKTAGDLPEMALEDEDHFFVPQVPTTVSVLGSVYNQGAFRYRDGERVQNYVDKAGGATREADKSRAFVMRADGSLISKQRVGRFEKVILHPGDTVLMPISLRANTRLSSLITLAQLGSGLGLGVLAIALAATR